jgi:hypothetical protein
MTDSHPNPELIALGVRQPWAELILRGIKTIEVRSQDTNVRGPIYVYSSKKISEHPAAITAAKEHGLDLEALPRGVLVGTVEIHRTALLKVNDAAAACVPAAHLVDQFGWYLRSPVRLDEPLAVRFLPYGVWFYPFRRRNEGAPRRRRGAT